MNVRVLEHGDWVSIRLRPVKAWAYWLFGLLFVALGVGVLFLLGRGIRLTCEADAKGRCELARVFVAGWQGESFPVAELMGSRVDTVRAAGTGRMDLVIETTGGDRGLPLASADGPEKLRLADEVRRFVADPASGSLDIRDDTRPIGIPFGLLVIVAGVVIILVQERVTIVADRSAGAMVVHSRRFFSRKTVELRLADIEEISTPSWRVRGAESCSVVLHLAGGRELSLTRTPLFTGDSAAQVIAVLQRLRAPGQARAAGA